MDRTNLQEIEYAVSQLSGEDRAQFRTWFAEFAEYDKILGTK